jgi:hypothetical protein
MRRMGRWSRRHRKTSAASRDHAFRNTHDASHDDAATTTPPTTTPPTTTPPTTTPPNPGLGNPIVAVLTLLSGLLGSLGGGR